MKKFELQIYVWSEVDPDPKWHEKQNLDPALKSNVRDPKLIISDPDPDPDPQIENHEFRIRIRIRILDPDPSVTRDGEKKLTILVILKTKMGWNL